MHEGYSTWSVFFPILALCAIRRTNSSISNFSAVRAWYIKWDFSLKGFIPKLWHHLLTMTVPSDIQAPLSLLFQRHSILKLFKRLTVGHALPGTPLNIRQRARVLWQSLILLSQCSEHVMITHNFCICVRGIPCERHGYTDVVFTPPTYCRLLTSSTLFVYIIIIIIGTYLCTHTRVHACMRTVDNLSWTEPASLSWWCISIITSPSTFSNNWTDF